MQVKSLDFKPIIPNPAKESIYVEKEDSDCYQLRRLFHGILASNSPIPQKSVTPANTRPAPTNPASQMK
jgi:hypothetical protein